MIEAGEHAMKFKQKCTSWERRNLWENKTFGYFWPYGVSASRTLCRDDEWEAYLATCRPSLPRGLCGLQGVWGGRCLISDGVRSSETHQDGNQPVCVLCTRPGPWLQPPRLPHASLSIAMGGWAG